MAAAPAYPQGPDDTTGPVTHGWASFALLPASLARDPDPKLRAAKLVLLALASYTDAERSAWPSVGRLARDVGVDRRTVQRALATAEAAGYLHREVRSVDGRSTTRYTLLGGAAPTPPPGGTHAAPGAAPTPPEAVPREQDHLTDTPPAPSGAAPPESERVAEVFQAWAATQARPGACVLTDKRRRLIRARLAEGYSAADLIAAVQGWQHSPFHRGENRDGTVYSGIELLLRDGAHVERFRDLANGDAPVGRGPVSERARRQEALLASALAAEPQAMLAPTTTPPRELPHDRS